MRQINEAIRQIINLIKKNAKKEALSECCQIQNMNEKNTNELNLETNTTTCKYLQHSRHGNLLLRKWSPHIFDMCDVSI